MILLFTVNCLLLTSCIPAETPAVLTNTPGAPITLDGDRYTNAAFSVQIPQGWRVITSPADSTPAVTFAAPDGCTVIHLATRPADVPTAPNCDQSTRPTSQTITRGARTIHIVASAAGTDLTGVLQPLIDSLQTFE